MRFLAAVSAVVLISISAFLFYSSYVSIQDAIRNGIQEKLVLYGYENAQVNDISFRLFNAHIGSIVLNDTNTISNVDISFSPLNYIRNSRIRKIHIENIILTGTINDDVGFILAGVNMLHPSLPYPMDLKSSEIPFNKLTWDNLQINIETPYGYAFLLNKGDMWRENQNMHIKTNLFSESELLSFDFNFEGHFDSEGIWQFEGSTENAKINFPLIQTDNMSGWLSLSRDQNQSPYISAEFISNTLQLHYNEKNFDLENLILSAEWKEHAFFSLIRGNFQDLENMTWAFDLSRDTDNIWKTTGSLRADTISDVLTFIEMYNLSDLSSLNKQQRNALNTLPGFVIDFNWQGNNLNNTAYPLDFSITDINTDISLTGKSIYNKDDSAISGNIYLQETNLDNLQSYIKPFQTLDGLKGAFVFDSKFEIKFQPFFTQIGPGFFEFKDGSITNPAFAVAGINTKQSFNDLFPSYNSEWQAISAENIKTVLEIANVKTRYYIKNNTLYVDKITGDIFDGNIEIAPFAYKNPDTPIKTTITLKNINLENLPPLLDMNELSLSGTVNGLIPVKIHNDDIEIINGMIESDTSGIIHYSPKEMPAFLNQDDASVETLKKAIQKFDYDSLNLVMNGNVNNNMTASLFLNGKNTDLFGERSIHLKLNLEGAVSALINELLEPAYNELVQSGKND